MRKPRVLINAISLAEGGGGRSYVFNALRELERDPRGFEFTVLAPRGALLPETLGPHGLVEVRLPGRARLVFRGLYEQGVLPFLARRFDLLYCPADVMPLWGWTPTVVALRNLNIYDRRFYDDTRTRALFLFSRLGLRRARAILCPSEAAAEAIAPLVGIARERITVVPHGIAPEAFDETGEASSQETPYLFLPARLERHKNFDVLLEGLLRQSDPTLEVWIAGSDRLDPEWAAHVRGRVEALGLGSRVRFLGDVPYAQILRYYRGAVALVFPSLLETFGHPLLEAMLAGTPVVASDIPASRELGGDAALYFDPNDAEGLVRAIERVRAEPEATRERVERGRARAREFSWAHSMDRLCALFDDVLTDR